MKPGPKEKPTDLKRLQGVRADRINDAAPVPSALVPTPPEGMSEAARLVWDRYAPDMIRKSVLSFWDEESFARLCQLIVDYWEAETHLRENGKVITVLKRELKDGTLIYAQERNDYWRIKLECLRELNALGARFGMTPSERSQITIHDDAGTGDRDSARLFSFAQSRQA